VRGHPTTGDDNLTPQERERRRKIGETNKSRALDRRIFRLYFVKERSITEIAREIGRPRGFVDSRTQRLGRKRRSIGEGIRLVKRGRPALGLPSRKVDNWKLIELKVLAHKSNQEIARQFHCAYPSIWWALHRMGFPSGEHRFGEVFDRAALRRLREMSGLNKTELKDELGVKYDTLESLLSKRGPEKQPHLNTVRKVIEWQEKLFQDLMKNGRYAQSSIIRTFFPNLRESWKFLLKVLNLIGDKLREEGNWSLAELQRYLWEQAMRETALEEDGRNPGNLFRRFLPWAPELTPFLGQEELQELRGVHRYRVARQILAKRLSTSPPTLYSWINPAQAQGIRPIPPAEIRHFIELRERDRLLALAGANGQGVATGKGGGGGRKRLDPTKTDAYKYAGMVKAAIPICGEMFIDLPNRKKLNVLKRRWERLGFSSNHIDSAVFAISARRPAAEWPLLAARKFVSLSLNKSYVTIRNAHQQFPD
jgi:transposase-like protein